MSKDWLPRSRTGIIAMGKTWSKVLKEKGTIWGVPTADVDTLDLFTKSAEEKLTKAMSSERNAVINAQCKTAFNTFTGCMRTMKRKRFQAPPLGDADFISLELKPPDTIKTPIPVPDSQMGGSVIYRGPHLLMVRAYELTGPSSDPRSDHGIRIYWGILWPEAALEDSGGHYLTKAAVHGADLVESEFTCRKSHLFDFPEETSGKTVYFCIRRENAKGGKGPWGTLFSAVIP